VVCANDRPNEGASILDIGGGQASDWLLTVVNGWTWMTADG
jgi:hypothetical protein